MKIVVTGHTGFKGSWLVLYLSLLGHQVSGISKNPTSKSLFESAEVEKHLVSDHRMDIRNAEELQRVLFEIKPDVVFHLAAQSLVLDSFKNPRETYETNFMGTFNVLETSMNVESIKNILVITSDKVYTNTNSKRKFRETDSLGGGDPYSNSKAVADVLTQNWNKTRDDFNIGILRAGNVIGGGDFAKNRLIPDIVEAHASDTRISIRNPKSIRPWQHVFDCLSGYEKAFGFLAKGNSGTWNIGPNSENYITVESLITKCSRILENDVEIENVATQHPEKSFLALSSKKARKELKWEPKLNLDESLELTLNWYLQYLENPKRIPEYSLSQLKEFLIK